MKKLSKQQTLRHEEDYVAFLEKRLASKHFKANAGAEEIQKKLKLRLLRGEF